MKAAEFSSMWKTHADVSQSQEFYIVSDLVNQLQATRYGYVRLLSPEKETVTVSREAVNLFNQTNSFCYQ